MLSIKSAELLRDAEKRASDERAKQFVRSVMLQALKKGSLSRKQYWRLRQIAHSRKSEVPGPNGGPKPPGETPHGARETK